MTAMLQYKNTADRDSGQSPAEIVFGRKLEGMIPVDRHILFNNNGKWQGRMMKHERAMAKRRDMATLRWSEKTKSHKPLSVGDFVAVQNGAGNNPKRWDRRGIIVSTEDHNKYDVKQEGLRRLTFRNCKHL